MHEPAPPGRTNYCRPSATWEVVPDPASDDDLVLDYGVAYAIDGETYEYADDVSVKPSLLAYYRFEGDFRDSSGNGRDAAPGNDVGFDAGDAIEGRQPPTLDGDDDYVNLAEPNGFLSDSFSSWTVSTWIDPDDMAGTQSSTTRAPPSTGWRCGSTTGRYRPRR